MSELRGFWEIDVDEEPDERARKAAEFLQKMDHEGGIQGMLDWGGPEAFPEELRSDAEACEQSQRWLRTAIEEWAADRGVLA